ncbi:MAG TPA: hypothetical protein VFO46_02150 [Candidatus Sulfotelmatobacter sp.]|nr:hypothetical protein [Candidatus Sulfotelmatobacter sp.]
MKSTIIRPRKMLVAFINDLSGRVLHQTAHADRLLAESLRLEELQMDWLRSEDLKEEKNVTAPIRIIAVYELYRSRAPQSVPLDMHRMNSEHLARDPSFAADMFLREEPEEEEEDEEEDDGGEEDDDGKDGYSE